MLTTGFNHVAVLTADLDRFCAFYGDVFGAVAEYEERTSDLRMRVVRVGPTATFNVFEVAGSEQPHADAPMFQRGRLDHLALHVADADAFEEVRRRLAAHDVATSEVNDFGRMLGVTFRDPDGMWLEVCVEPVERAHRSWSSPFPAAERRELAPPPVVVS